MEIKCNQTKDLQFPFLFFFTKQKNPEIVENSPKDIEKMLSLVKTHDSKKDVIVINLLRTARCMLLYLQLDNIVPFIQYYTK